MEDKKHFLLYVEQVFMILGASLLALTLMIAESRTEEKDTMLKVIVNLINQNNR